MAGIPSATSDLYRHPYGKQIEEVAKFLDIAQRATNVIVVDSAAILAAKDSHISDLRRAFDKLSPLEDATMQDIGTLRLVVPKRYGEAAEALLGGMLEPLRLQPLAMPCAPGLFARVAPPVTQHQ